MEHGIFIEKGISDWQIVQHTNNFATVTVSGSWCVIKDAVKIGITHVCPMIRVMSEDDNSPVIPWQNATAYPAEDFVTGQWSASLHIPAGGLYRIETGLQVTSVRPGLVWTFRGDTRLHIGVGDVFLIAGQSNAAGYGKDSAFDPPEIGVHIFRNRKCWDLAAHPLNESSFAADSPNADRGVTGTSPFLSFGKQLRRISHYPVGLIASAMGGMPIKQWNPEGGKLYVNMLEQVSACGKIAGVLWYQGCSNTDDKGIIDYQEKLYDMIHAFRRDLGYPVNFFTFQLNREIGSVLDDGYGRVREIQRQASHDLDHVYILPTIHSSLSDTIHNNSHSNTMLGESLAKLCGHVMYHSAEFRAPEITSAFLNPDNELTLRFDHLRNAFFFPSLKAKECGFSVEDSKGSLSYGELSYDSKEPEVIRIQLEKPPVGDCFVSFAWEANPTKTPPVDDITYLPPLSFYKYPVKNL